MNEEIGKTISCVRCGACMSVCPLYSATCLETDVARGKLSALSMLEQGELSLRDVSSIISRCLLCGKCSSACPNNIEPDKIIISAREELFHQEPKRLYHALLRHINLMDASMNNRGALIQKLVLKFALLFSLDSRSYIPEIAETPFLKKLDQRSEKAVGDIKLGLFVGCGGNYLFPETTEAFVSLLKRLNLSPYIPRHQGCCGLISQNIGDKEKAIALAKHIIDLFSPDDLDYIVTPCASCSSHLKSFAQLLGSENKGYKKAILFSNKVMDASDFLVNVVNHKELACAINAYPKTNIPIRVHYHKPCHIQESGASLRLLSAIPSVILTDTSGTSQCCGHAGIFNISNFRASMQILEKTMAEITKAKPDIIATDCTGCILQFQEGTARIKKQINISVAHPLVLVLGLK
ncbi:MAG: (Fe-S)-binding protein [Pseudomonadota bacterium]